MMGLFFRAAVPAKTLNRLEILFGNIVPVNPSKGNSMSLGSDLREAREAGKISLETVSQKTKIPVKYIEAIERDDYSVFPSQTYARGFIRAVAKVVGLDPQVLTRQFNADNKPEQMRIEPKNAEAELEKALGWRPTLDRPPVFRRPNPEGDLNLEFVDEEFAEPTQRESSRMHRPVRGARKTNWHKLANQVFVVAAVLAIGWTGYHYGRKALSKVKWSASKPEATPPEAKSYAPVEVVDKYQHLILKALDKSWVLVTMDDGQSSSETDLGQGEVKTYKALKNFKVKLGNAGGVDVQFNGKPLGVLGVAGQVVEIQLPPQDESKNADDHS